MSSDALCSAAEKVVPQLGDLLKQGSIGLALAVVLVLFASLLILQWQANKAGQPGDALQPTVQLMKYGMGVIIILFLVSALAPMIDKRLNAPSHEHLVSFSLDPSEIEGEDLIPRLVVNGSGALIDFKNGTGKDTVDGQRDYSFKVGKLVKEIRRLNTLVLKQGREASNDH